MKDMPSHVPNPGSLTDSKTQPAFEVRLGRVKATLWANSGEHGTFYNARVFRLYKDANGKWAQSESFSRDDLPVLIETLRLAYLWQFEQSGDSL